MSEAQIIPDAQGGILLTPEGYRQLQQELEHLTVVKRPEIADRIRESQQHGEFSEDVIHLPIGCRSSSQSG